MDRPYLQELVDLASAQCDAGMRRHDECVLEIQKDYAQAWALMDAAKNADDLKQAWAAMDAACKKEADHLDQVAGWLTDSHEKIVAGFYKASDG